MRPHSPMGSMVSGVSSTSAMTTGHRQPVPLGGGPVVTAGMLSSEIAEDLVPGIRVVYLIKKSLSRKRANRLTPEERQELDSYRDSLLPAQFRELREVAQRKRILLKRTPKAQRLEEEAEEKKLASLQKAEFDAKKRRREEQRARALSTNFSASYPVSPGATQGYPNTHSHSASMATGGFASPSGPASMVGPVLEGPSVSRTGRPNPLEDVGRPLGPSPGNIFFSPDETFRGPIGGGTGSTSGATLAFSSPLSPPRMEPPAGVMAAVVGESDALGLIRPPVGVRARASSLASRNREAEEAAGAANGNTSYNFSPMARSSASGLATSSSVHSDPASAAQPPPGASEVEELRKRVRELERVRAQEREHSTRTIQQYQEEQTNLENIILAERDDRDQALERVRKLEAEIQEIRHQSEAQQQRGKTELQELQRKNETLAAQLNTMTDTIESLERELGEGDGGRRSPELNRRFQQVQDQLVEEQRRSAALVEEVHRLQGLEPKGSEDLEVSHALAQQLSQQVDELRLEIRTLKERNGDLEGQLEQMAVEMESRVQRRVESLRQQVEAEVRTAFEESSSTAALEQQLRKLQHMRAGIARSISGLVTVSSGLSTSLQRVREQTRKDLQTMQKNVGYFAEQFAESWAKQMLSSEEELARRVNLSSGSLPAQVAVADNSLSRADLDGTMPVDVDDGPLVRVCVRIKKLPEGAKSAITVVDRNTLEIQRGAERTSFIFDRVFGPQATNEDMESELEGLARAVLSGESVCLVGFGQRGGGKSRVMEGSPTEGDMGLAHRLCIDVFREMNVIQEGHSFRVRVSSYEVYDESLRDLLSSNKSASSSSDRLTDMSCMDVTGVSHFESILEEAYMRRRHPVDAGRLSSRKPNPHAHSILSVQVEVTDTASLEQRFGRITVLQPASSDVSQRGVSGLDASRQVVRVRQSLTALGDIMMSVATRQSFIPYRNSFLTNILRDSMDAKSRILLVVCVKPGMQDYSSALKTLQFGSKIRACRLKAQLPVHTQQLESSFTGESGRSSSRGRRTPTSAASPSSFSGRSNGASTPRDLRNSVRRLEAETRQPEVVRVRVTPGRR